MASFVSNMLGYGPKRVPPLTDPTDEVLPCHFWDDTKMIRAYTYMWTFRFEEVLDPDLLHKALVELFEMGSWRRLGGRLRLRADGKGEVHVPKKFTPERPAVYFTKEHHRMRIRDHPEAAKLPAAGSATATFPSARNFSSLGVGPGAPRCIDDYFCSDLPQYALHVVTFEDATLVSLNHSHATSDMGGVSAIMSAWSLVLAGHKDRVPPLAGWGSDPMAALYKAEATKEAPLEKSLLADRLLTGWRLAVFGIRFLWNAYWSNHESRIVSIPKKTMDALLAKARSQMPQSVDGKSSEKPFISENDVVVALMQHIYSKSQPVGSKRTIMVLMAVDPRERVKSAFRSDTAYVQNAPCGVAADCSAEDAQNRPLGELALECRKAVAAQATEAQMKATASFVYEKMVTDGIQPVVGDPLMEFTVFSNWSKGKLLDRTDFGPAVVKASQSTGTPGKPIYYHAQPIESKNPMSTTVCIIMGRDKKGDFWMSCELKPETWSALMSYLEDMDAGN